MNKNPRDMSPRQVIMAALVLLTVLGIVYSFFANDTSNVKPLTSTELVKAMNDKEVANATIQQVNGAYTVSGKYKSPHTVTSSAMFDLFQTKQKVTKFTSTVLPNDTSVREITETAKATKVNVTVKQAEAPGFWTNLLITIIPMILLVVVFHFMMNKGQGKGSVLNFGKTKAKPSDPKKNDTRFTDVAGADEEKQELVEVVEFLKSSEKFLKMGARIPKGILLEGPPGTGKTLLAKAVAGEAGVPFFSMAGSDFVEMYVGLGASRVRELFEAAKKESHAIIFIDEIDAVGRKRGSGTGGGNDEREQTLNQILIEMDGFSKAQGVIVLASTNRSDVLDPALLRSGRFDRKVMVGAPDVKGREEILKVHAVGKPLDDQVDLAMIAQQTPGYVGADLENLLNEAALLAARQDQTKILPANLDEAEDRIFQGPAKANRKMTDIERRTTAYHEAGHALVGLIKSEANIVRKVTIVPRGRIGGYALMTPKADRYNLKYSEALEQLAGLMGGRAAEMIVFNEPSSGAANDFQQATGLARQMVTAYGMSEKLGMVQLEGNASVGYDQTSQGGSYSMATAAAIDEEVRRITLDAFRVAREVLEAHPDKLQAIAEALLSVETLDEQQITDIFETGTFTPKVLTDDAVPASYDDIKKTVTGELETTTEPEQLDD